MTTDPVVRAAQRAWDAKDPLDGIAYVPGDHGIWTPEAMEAAACEALKPIRAVLDKLAADTEPPCGPATRIQLFEKAISDLSLLVFRTEELEP
ncbi:Uncharacterised protein [Mycobacteroides abscessus subsp. abscessus]|uniref:Uncharacterized protein n=2 Tax=Mycobacteroides abscessus TaxID=36809 RepID=A0A0U1BH16_9MYCO|nr:MULTISPECIES: hypothetical protein [Mycobacteroides]KRQ26123.1 hypothetical protein AOT87_08545 [Mycobacteroides sp. H003]KRQ59871.1 hypothetical protein AOT94_08625 [Mycobacteroides sp. HXVII]MBN7344715.1 hypothetical protein [Mycobacteroides abscessus subsp. massiliense]MBN7397527.1 hypothetical protein [Mycobacteroides abscessus subsp. abscessus]MBN7532272.1 hypothetical protein [Mycobacteroides abscessus subsp. abscessus]